MKIAINQPYFFPYLGYFQLIAAADVFVAYENVAYTRKSWISRNRLQGKAKAPYFISLPTVKTTQGVLIKEVRLHHTAPQVITKLLRRIHTDYARAAHFGEVFGEIEQMFMMAPRTSLAAFNNHCLKWICDLLELQTKLSLKHETLLGFESDLEKRKVQEASFEVKSQRVFGLMSHFGATHYLNLPGGSVLYQHSDFDNEGFGLDFLAIQTIEYPQFQNAFTPSLSILDVLLHCGIQHTRKLIYSYKFKGANQIFT